MKTDIKKHAECFSRKYMKGVIELIDNKNQSEEIMLTKWQIFVK